STASSRVVSGSRGWAGRTNAEIGQDLHIAISTVKFHLGSLMAKLQARNRVELAIWAYETGRME
ncbi:MAG: helix-turn-helix transcriptional regulator, partial [Micrococcaceae bacterium]|nr:helix-turn-helix transcriptional regulator [Micrococcaceae bacterium]